jgi:hypothetical protein
MNTVDEVKAIVRKYKAVGFKTRDITCDKTRLILKDKYQVDDSQALMEELGINNNLNKEIFKRPDENWPVIKNALDSIEESRTFGVIVDPSNKTTTHLKKAPDEDHDLNYDQRIDGIMNSLDTARQNFKSIEFSPDGDVLINTTTKDQVDCGQGDLWEFGATTTIGYTSQQFNNYFLRLICTNGMTTKENLSYRQSIGGPNISKQFIAFTKDTEFSKVIIPRVQKLKDNRASFYEVNCIAKELNKDQIVEFMPWYDGIVDTYETKGFKIEKFSAKKQRFVYTNQNLYDVFNLGTNLASHHAKTIGKDKALTLNKVSASMFVNGPNLTFQVLDAYKN